MANLAIKGHKTHGKEVIEILEMLGGVNKWSYLGDRLLCTYYINCEGIINYTSNVKGYNLQVFTLEEFLEKYPFKVGDKVLARGSAGEITDMKWQGDSFFTIKEGGEVVYTVMLDTEEEITFSVEDLRPYKEETMEEQTYLNSKANKEKEKIKESLKDAKRIMEEQIKIDIPKGYEFAGVDDANQQVVFEKIGYQYPKTYEECCKIVNASPYVELIYNVSDGKKYSYDIDNLQIYENIRRLKICRDAYWKIAGEQMGLGKPWEPDLENEELYCIQNYNKQIIKSKTNTAFNKILIFPTEEMRDKFCGNFKDLIEQCKELL